MYRIRLSSIFSALFLTALLSGAPLCQPLLDIDRAIADFILSDPASLLDRSASDWEGALSLCSEMGWSEREYDLRKARYESGRIRNLEEARRERRALATLAVRTGRDAEAIRFMASEATDDPKELAAQGLAHLRIGKLKEGGALVRRAIEQGSPAGDLLLYRLALAMRSSEEEEQGIPILLDLAGRNNLYRTRSLQAAALLLFEKGRDDEARALLVRRYGESFSKLAHRELLYRLAQHSSVGGDDKKAKRIWKRILGEWPSHRRALDSFRALRKLEEEKGEKQDERLSLAGARTFRQNGRPDEAAALLRPYLDRPENDPLHGEALLEMGRISYSTGRYESAISQLNDLTKGGGPLSRNAILYTARSYKKMNEWRKAIDSYGQYVKHFPGSSLAPEVQWEIAWRWKILGEYEKAVEAFRQLVKQFPSSNYGRKAHLQVSLTLDLAGKTEEGLALLDRLLKRGKKIREEDAVLFWAGDMAERLGRPERAASAYGKLVDQFPESYYGLRAAGRMGISIIQSPEDAGAFAEGDDPLLALVRSWPAKTRRAKARSWEMLEYFSAIGEGTEARKEASKGIKNHQYDAESLLELARLCRRLGLADYTIRCGRRLQELAESVDANDVHPYLLTLIYPVGFLDLVVAEAKQYDDVDPFFVLGLMRQESWFRPDAHSHADARGLLQIIPPTGKSIAHELGDTDSFSPETLLEPEKNIRYGIWYVRTLQQRYGGNLSIVASAYNAGEANADIWLARNSDYPDEEFVESINYSETRTYVKRTLSGYWIYRSLYRYLAANLLVG